MLAEMSKNLRYLLAWPVLTAVTGASQPAVDKSAFDLFNPTPTESLRELTTDDRGATETPYTVDAGHFQIEMTLVSYASESDSSNSGTLPRDTWAFAPQTLPVGLVNQLVAQLQVVPFLINFQPRETN